MSARAAIAMAAALAGCGGDLPSVSLVDKLRVLAVRAEPPEVDPGQTAALDLLVAEPRVQQIDGGPTATRSALWLACPIPPGASEQSACGLGARDLGAALPPSCADQPDAPVCLIGSRSGGDLSASYRASATARSPILITVAVSDSAGGALDCLVTAAQHGGVPAEPDRCVLALKRLGLRDPSRPANRNPALAAFTLADLAGDLGYVLDDGDDTLDGSDGGVRFLPSPPKDPPVLRLAATRAADAAEMEPTVDAAGQPAGLVYEKLSLAWYSTSGKILAPVSFFAPDGCDTQDACPTQPPELAVGAKWLAPTLDDLVAMAPTDGATDFWAVIRDDRGGVGWLAGHARRAP